MKRKRWLSRLEALLSGLGMLGLWGLRAYWISATSLPDWFEVSGIVLLLLPFVMVIGLTGYTLIHFQWRRLLVTMLMLVASLTSMPIAKVAVLNWFMIILVTLGLVKLWFPMAMQQTTILGLGVVVSLLFVISLMNPVWSARWSYASYVDPVTAMRAKIYLTTTEQQELQQTSSAHIETRQPKIRIDSADYRNFGVTKYGFFYIASF